MEKDVGIVIHKKGAAKVKVEPIRNTVEYTKLIAGDR
jgi:hypothetical protein